MILSEGRKMILDIFSDTDRIHSYDKDLTQAAENIRILLQCTYARFNEATDPLIIEALIYRMKELETQYSFLIKKAKLERLCGEIGSRVIMYEVCLDCRSMHYSADTYNRDVQERRFFKCIFLSAFQGLAALLAVNSLGLLTGVSLAVNWYTVLACVCLGIPASISMLVLDIIM